MTNISLFHKAAAFARYIYSTPTEIQQSNSYLEFLAFKCTRFQKLLLCHVTQVKKVRDLSTQFWLPTSNQTPFNFLNFYIVHPVFYLLHKKQTSHKGRFLCTGVLNFDVYNLSDSHKQIAGHYCTALSHI